MIYDDRISQHINSAVFGYVLEWNPCTVVYRVDLIMVSDLTVVLCCVFEMSRIKQ